MPLVNKEEYERMVIEHRGVCAICGSQPKGRKLAVDHDHATGVIRGLLCHSCNAALGLFRDDPVLLRYAAVYLERKHPKFAAEVDEIAKRRLERLAWWRNRLAHAAAIRSGRDAVQLGLPG